MKNNILIYLLIVTSSITNAQTDDYLIASPEIDSIILSYEDSTIASQTYIPLRENACKIFCEAPDTAAYIQLFWDYPDDTIHLAIYNYTNNSHSDTIKLLAGERIAINDCFKDKFIPKQAPMKAFIHYINRHIPIIPPCSRSNNTNQKIPQLSFEDMGIPYFWKVEEILIPFKIAQNNTIKSIFIIDNQGHVFLSLGDSTHLIRNYYTIKNEELAVPITNQIIPFIDSQDNFNYYQLKWQQFNPYLQQALQVAHKYQLGIILENEAKKPYFINFQLLSGKDKAFFSGN